MNLSSPLFKIIVIALFLATFSSTVQAAPVWQQSPGQFLIEAIKIKPPLYFCNEPVPYDDDVKERLEREMLITLDNSDDIILWIKRSHRYFPHIEKKLKDNGLPDDLKYIVIIESSLRPLAASHKGAVGFWQFIESTGLRYGMTINQHTDERRSFFSSTDAAISYLKDLYGIFGSWTLAAAAYNMGEDGLRTEMLMQRVNNYYQLHLNQETQRYVFRILAAKLILSNPAKYGFILADNDLYKPVEFDRVKITVSRPVPLFVIASAANTYFKVIKDLNPHIKNYDLPAGEHVLLIPKDAAKSFHERLEYFVKQLNDGKGKSVYTVAKGDNISVIAKRFNVSVKAIMLWNGISSSKQLSPGDKIIIYTDY